MSLTGKVAVVTGGSRGIGRAVCLRLAALGAKVGINFVSNPAAAQETLDMIEAAGGQGFLAQFDVCDPTAVSSAIKALGKEQGPVEVLVNNAGITRDGVAAMMKDQDWEDVLSTNLKGAFLCSKAVMRQMMKQRSGRIVNIGSVVGFLGNAGQVNYSAAKAGLVGMTKALARELAPRGITVNCVAPGYIVTEMTEQLGQEVQANLQQQIPLGTLGTTEQVAGAVAFLLSEDAAYITGQTLHVNGGMYMGN